MREVASKFFMYVLRLELLLSAFIFLYTMFKVIIKIFCVLLSGTEVDGGILPRAMDLLFKSIEGKLYTAMDLKPHRCRDYIKLNKEQVREESAIKNSMLRLMKEVQVHFLY